MRRQRDDGEEEIKYGNQGKRRMSVREADSEKEEEERWIEGPLEGL